LAEIETLFLTESRNAQHTSGIQRWRGEQAGISAWYGLCVCSGSKGLAHIAVHLTQWLSIFGSIEASILPCHGSDPGSIPGQRDYLLLKRFFLACSVKSWKRRWTPLSFVSVSLLGIDEE
jgi:hypothetical protein